MSQTERIESLLAAMTLREKVSLLSGLDLYRSVPVSRLGIGSITFTDGPLGVHADQPEPGRKHGWTTAFPCGMSLAAAWDPQLARQVGQALAAETLAMGCNVLLGPCVNIVRHPLGGRNFECYSEDPYLAGQIGIGWVSGLQAGGVGAAVKHFACNNQEVERKRGSSDVDERTLREIYLPAFEAIVKQARPWLVMSAYNRVNGQHATQNRHLITDILKNEWGFGGVVLSDFGGVRTTVDSVLAGLDLEMPGPALYWGKLLEESVEHWLVPPTRIDDAARRMLGLLAKAGALDGLQARGSVNTPQHQSLAREVARQSLVLLKNAGNVLPLRPATMRSLAVIGPNADYFSRGGGSARVVPPHAVTTLGGLRARLGESVAVRCARGCPNELDVPVVPRELLMLPDGSGHGAQVEFFTSPDCSGEPFETTFTETIRSYWWRRTPSEEVGGRDFSARWTATLTPVETGEHVVRVVAVGGLRCWIDDKLIASESLPDVAAGEPATRQAEVRMGLQAGRQYRLRVEYDCLRGEPPGHLRMHVGPACGRDWAAEIAAAAGLAAQCDAAVVCIGYAEGHETEGRDRPDMDLPPGQEALVRAVVAANPRTAVVLTCGAPVTMPWLDAAPAALLAWYPGMEGGAAVAEALLGDANPCGKLPVTFPRRIEDTPAFGHFGGGDHVLYGEGVFVGYRHYDARAIEPLMAFGHGLSYTSFGYSDLNLPAASDLTLPVEVSLTVTNTGPVAGSEIVQVYIGDLDSSLPRPPRELKGFAKVSLAPGESRRVAMALDRRAFAFYDPGRGDWVVESGRFEIFVGASSRDIRLRGRIEVQQGASRTWQVESYA